MNQFELIKSAFNGNVRQYRFVNRIFRYISLDTVIYLHRNQIKLLLSEVLTLFKKLTFYLSFKVVLIKGVEIREIFLTTNADRVWSQNMISLCLENAFNKILNNFENYQEHGSGFIFINVKFIDIHIAKYE
jgi:hypothetical protein